MTMNIGVYTFNRWLNHCSNNPYIDSDWWIVTPQTNKHIARVVPGINESFCSKYEVLKNESIGNGDSLTLEDS